MSGLVEWGWLEDDHKNAIADQKIAESRRWHLCRMSGKYPII